jgi:hypothetical protein
LAASCYKKAIEFLKKAPKKSQETKQVKLACYLNLALAELNLGHNQEAILYANIGLDLDRNNIKALFRRGRANFNLGKLSQAKADFEAALRCGPQNATILKALADCEQEIFLQTGKHPSSTFTQKPSSGSERKGSYPPAPLDDDDLPPPLEDIPDELLTKQKPSAQKPSTHPQQPPAFKPAASQPNTAPKQAPAKTAPKTSQQKKPVATPSYDDDDLPPPLEDIPEELLAKHKQSPAQKSTPVHQTFASKPAAQSTPAKTQQKGNPSAAKQTQPAAKPVQNTQKQAPKKGAVNQQKKAQPPPVDDDEPPPLIDFTYDAPPMRQQPPFADHDDDDDEDEEDEEYYDDDEDDEDEPNIPLEDFLRTQNLGELFSNPEFLNL